MQPHEAAHRAADLFTKAEHRAMSGVDHEGANTLLYIGQAWMDLAEKLNEYPRLGRTPEHDDAPRPEPRGIVMPPTYSSDLTDSNTVPSSAVATNSNA